MPKKPTPPDIRFDARVVKSPDPEGCWEFQGSKVNRHGHRRFTLSTGRYMLAHRYAWARVNGDPGPLCVLHQCDNPPCVRLEHLFLGTRAVNNADMDRKGRRKPHIGEAHPLAKLTNAKVREIRHRRHDEKLSYPRLAKLYGVATTTIQNIIEGKTWKAA